MTLAQAIWERIGNVLPGEGILVADPDELLRAREVAASLAERGVALVVDDDPIDVRLAVEALPHTQSFVVATDSEARRRALPADVQARAVRELTISAGEFLQPLSFDATASLGWDELVAAWRIAQGRGVELDRSESASLLMRHLYDLDPDTMRDARPLLLGLLRYHRQARPGGISHSLRERFVERVGDQLPGIATQRALEDRRAFLEWLADLWQRAVSGAEPEWLDALTAAPLADHLDEYFKDGSLTPVPVSAGSALSFGVTTVSEPPQDQVEHQLDDVSRQLNRQTLDYKEWLAIAHAFATATATQMGFGEPASRYLELRAQLNDRFVPWILDNLASLSSLPAVPMPVTVHRVPRAIQLSRQGKPAALLVMDGMSLAAWQLLAPRLRELDAHVAEGSLFAWIPTLTSISRQAIFAGSLPAHFASSIDTTAKEGDHWRAYWHNEAGLGDPAVGYGKLRLAAFTGRDALLAQLRTSGLGREVLGFAVEDIDLLLHSEVIDERALYARLDHWAERELLLWLIDILLDEGYRVYITSDHGFVGVQPIGGSKAGATADKHGRFERYSDPVLADAAAAKIAEPWRRWKGFGLPPGHHIVFAPMFGMYFTDRHTRLTHGGPTIEEVVVPWVEIYR